MSRQGEEHEGRAILWYCRAVWLIRERGLAQKQGKFLTEEEKTEGDGERRSSR